ncbi:MAG: hypothetical protein WBK20_13775 [Spirochaetota bacterium]
MNRIFIHCLYALHGALYFLLTIFTPVYAHDVSGNEILNFSLSGYYKNLFIGYKTDEYYSENYTLKEKLLVTDVNRLRLSPHCDIGPNIIFHADIDNEYIISNYTQSKTFDATWIGFSYDELYSGYYDKRTDTGYYRLKLHRAFGKCIVGKATITLGRQLVRFGSGKIWNPLDIVNPISPLSFEGAEETKGVDALRFELYPAHFFEVGFVYVPQRKNNEFGDSFGNSVYLLRNKVVFGTTEIAMLAGKIMQRHVGGTDISLPVYDGLLRGSILLNNDRDNIYYIAGTGYDYSFESGFSILLEYFYNGYCLSNNDELYQAYSESLIYGMNEERYRTLAYHFLTYNRHYAGLSVSFSGASLFSASATTILDFEGHGAMLIPSVVYNVIEDCDLTFYMLYAIVTENNLSDFSSFDNRPALAAEVKYYF